MLKKGITNLPISIFKEGNFFIAYCPVLDLTTSGKSFEEVRKRIQEAIEIFFEELISRGTLEDVLKDLGWRKVKNRWQPPILIAQDYVTLKTHLLEKI